MPFSFQLCFRYLRGFDLDMSREAVEAAKEFRRRRRYAKYLLVVRVNGGVPNPEEEPAVNPDFWEPLE